METLNQNGIDLLVSVIVLLVQKSIDQNNNERIKRKSKKGKKARKDVNKM